MLISIGKQGRLGGLSNETAGTSGGAISYIPVLNKVGKVYSCPYTVRDAGGTYHWVSIWAHTASGGHVLLDSTYTPLNLDILNSVGTQLNYAEPIEVYANGIDFYISHYVFNKNQVGYKVIK